MLTADYFVREANENDDDENIFLLMEQYIFEETILKSYMIKCDTQTKEDFKRILREYFGELISELLKSKMILVAVHQENEQIVGHLVMEPLRLRPNTPEEEEIPEYTKLVPTAPKLIADLLRYVNEIHRNSKISEKYPDIEKSLKLRYLGIDERHRQKGLSGLLLQTALDWARNHNYSLVHGIFSSIYSQRVANKAGLKSIYNCDLNKFKDETGYPAFANSTPNNIISVMAIKL